MRNKNVLIKTEEKMKETSANGIAQKKGKKYAKFALLITLNLICVTSTVNAAGPDIVTSGMQNLQDIIAAFISSVGSIVVLWGLFEFGNAMQSNDGMMQSASFKRIGGGLVMTIGPQLLSILV